MVKGADWTKEELEKEYIGTMTAVTIPVDIRVKGKHRVLNMDEMETILRRAQLIALENCGCREKVKGCDAPLDVCIALDDDAEEQIKKGVAKQTSLTNALNALARSHDAGLVHIAYTFKDNTKPGIICSCCSCCCHSMSALVRFGIPEAVVAANYVASTSQETCINCGKCVERCQFKARHLENDKLQFTPERCFGCGVCTSTCPTQSISLVNRHS